MNKSVSVVVTTCKRNHFLYRCLVSVLMQKDIRVDVIVVDDDPGLGAYELIRYFEGSNVKYVPVGGSENIAFNRNIGIAYAKSEWIAFCDDDDFWFKDKLVTQIDAIEEEKTKFVASNAMRVGVKCKKQSFVKSPKSELGLVLRNTVYLSSVVINRKVLSDVGGFNQDYEYVGIEDLELWLRVIACTKMVVVPNVLLGYQVHANGVSADKVNMFKKLLVLNERLYGERKKVLLKYIVKTYYILRIAVIGLRDGRLFN